MLKIDEKDHKIIKILREDARLSIRDISKITKIRPSTIHIRLQKLIKNKIIDKFTLKLNNQAIGENFIVFMLISTDKHIDKKAFTSNHIKEVFGITGEYDLIMKLKFKDVLQFNDFVIKFRKQNKLAKTLTMVATINIKEEL